MKLIRGERHRSRLEELNKEALEECDEVWVAVAYVTMDKYLIKPCYERKIPLKLWARYDYSIPVNVSILEWFLNKAPLAICKLVPDIFHPKIIWWRPYGVYIGSANLTNAAWGDNFEAGIFLSDDELDDNGIKSELETFFDEINQVSYMLTKEIVEEQDQRLSSPQYKDVNFFRTEFEKSRKLLRLNSLAAIQKKSDAKMKHKTEFLREWNSTLEYLRSIAAKVSEDKYRPNWVGKNVPSGVQADQFLHAYYYNKVMDKHKARHREFHDVNRSDPEQALEGALKWWAKLKSAPSNEDRMMHEWAPFIKKHLQKGKMGSLSENNFVEVFTKIHAFRNYADRAKFTTLGLQRKPPQMTSEERGELLARKLYDEISNNGKTFLELLSYVLYEGSFNKLSDRLFDVSFDNEYHIKHAGLSTFGETVGWVLPEKFPPRNGRTSKALYALGYDVTIHTE